jgi:hypothetical protein
VVDGVGAVVNQVLAGIERADVQVCALLGGIGIDIAERLPEAVDAGESGEEQSPKSCFFHGV